MTLSDSLFISLFVCMPYVYLYVYKSLSLSISLLVVCIPYVYLYVYMSICCLSEIRLSYSHHIFLSVPD